MAAGLFLVAVNVIFFVRDRPPLQPVTVPAPSDTTLPAGTQTAPSAAPAASPAPSLAVPQVTAVPEAIAVPLPDTRKPEKTAAAAQKDIEEKETFVPRAGVLVFVFDDAGQNMKQLQPFLDLPFPVTVAVLPGLPYSAQAAEAVRAAGKELILHQPMQAQNLSVNPGPGAIYPDTALSLIRGIILANLAEIGPVVGMNNHEGSLITESAEMMDSVLDICRENGIYFLDSRTTAASVAMPVSLQKAMKIWERDVFLDNTQNRTDILNELDRGLDIAARKGHAVMIGHVWSNDLARILSDLYPELVAKGYSFSTISRMIEQSSIH